MLAATTYPQDYVDAARARIDAQVAAYRDLATASRTDGAAAALDAFEPQFFNTMVLVLEGLFVHRVRDREGKDGNALNEVRVLAASLMASDGVMAADRTIRLKPETSVLGVAPGDEIRLGEDDFRRLADAYFAEIEARYASA